MMRARSRARGWIGWVCVVGALGALVACGDDDGGSNNSNTNAATTGDAGDLSDTPSDTAPDVEEEDTTPPEDSGDTAPDAPVDPDDPGLARTPDQALDDPQGADVSGDVAAGQVRAGVVQAGDGGISGVQSECSPGDLVLANAQARFCIEGPTTSSSLFFDGGRLVDAVPVGEGVGEGQGADRLEIAAVFVDVMTGTADRVEVIRDGTAGPLAVVRVTGRQEPSMYIAGVVSPALFRPNPLEIVTEYRLRPDAPSLEVVTFLRSNAPGPLNTTAGDLIFWGDTLEPVFPGTTTGSAPGAGNQGGLAMGRGVAYGWFTEVPQNPVVIPGIDLPAVPLVEPAQPLEPGATIVFRRHLAVATQVAGVLDALPAVVADHPILASALVSKTLDVTQGGAPAPWSRVELRRLAGDAPDAEDVVWYRDIADGQGRLALRVPEGGSFEAIVTSPEGMSATVAFEADGPSEISAELPEAATLEIRLSAVRGDQFPTPSQGRILLREEATGLTQWVHTMRGVETLKLRPGTWTWEASRGMEYDATSGTLELVAGESVTLDAQLTEVLPTPGFISGEFHQHQSPSLDSEVPVDTRVLGNIAEGVDFAVSSDHDAVTDFQPIIDMLGANDLIATLTGLEISPLYGHFGAYPVQADPSKPGRGTLTLSFRKDDGSIDWYPNGAALFEGIREELGARMIQSNHPRGSTGYFNSFNWDATKLPSEANDGFSAEFDTIELVNGKRLSNTPQVLQDWYALLNLGYRIVGVGNSDTHTIDNPPGFPRNYVPSTAVRAEDIDADAIVDGVLSGDVVIAGAAYLEFGPGAPSDPEAVRPGRLASGPSVEVEVRALTPPWAEVDRLIVVRNGLRVDVQQIGGGVEALVDFDSTLTFDTGGEDAWFHVIVCGTERAEAVYTGDEVFAISNPFYVDGDGDGVFTPPGRIDLGPVDEVFCPVE